VSAGGTSARQPAPRDPYGIGPVSGLVAPAIAVVALVVIAILTLSLLNGQLPIPTSTTPNTNGGAGGNPNNATPAPSNVVVASPEPTLKGSIVYAKAGNIWIQDANGAHQLTNAAPGTSDSMPAFSPDGQWVYYIHIVEGGGNFPGGGGPPSNYDLSTPTLMRVHTDGTGAQKLFTGSYRLGRYTWFDWMREPTPTPDGKAVILVTDGPNPTVSDIVLKRFDLATKQLTSLNLPESSGLGHQDPAWQANGRYLAYVKNQRDGSKGAPQIYRYDAVTQKTGPLTGPGYIAPSWSPDGRFLAATRTDSFGTDVVILDSRGKEVLRVTNDGHSFSPVWSPAGDAIAFLHLGGTIVDLQEAQLDDEGGNWSVAKTVDLTEVSGLDAISRPSWFIPPSELPAPSIAPTSSGSAAPADSGTGSSSSPGQ
jgi:Tol biopolymer transport system component